jgi:ribonuclease Y
MHLIIVIAVVAIVCGIIIGYIARALILTIQKNNLERSVAERLLNAREQAQAIIDQARQDIKQHEDRLARKEALLDTRQIELDERAQGIDEKKEIIAEEFTAVEIMKLAAEERLIAVAGFDTEQAREVLLAQAEVEYREDLQVRLHKMDTQLRETLNDRAKNILVTAIQRLAVPTANELTTSTVVLPNDEVKGKVIGKEGRNIRTFERFSGVELLVNTGGNCCFMF